MHGAIMCGMTEHPSPPLPSRGVCTGIFAVALAILVLQIALTRLLSVVLWYHFAFVAISLAMLGLALAGIALYLSPRLLRATPTLLPWYCRGAALTMFGALAYVTFFAKPADGTDLFAAHVVTLYLVLLVPFTLAGFAVSATLAFHARHIGTLYSRDLAGAALGCLLAVPLLDFGGAPTTILVGALLLALAGLGYAPAGRRAPDLLLCALLLAVTGVQVATDAFEPTAMHGVPDEGVEGREKDFAGWNSHSRVVVSDASDATKKINIDGHATTVVSRFDRQVDQQAVRAQIKWTPILYNATPYVALQKKLPEAQPAETLLIGPGGGLELLVGIYYGAHITGVELNGLIWSLMKHGPIADYSGHVYDAPNVTVHHDEARSWIRRSDRRFDLIQASMIDTWAATANGAFALAENALYTVEAFEDYRDHLTDEGVVHFMRWHEDPPRQSLRVLALIDAVMREQGVTELDRHILAWKEPQPGQMAMASLLWSPEPFSDEVLRHLQAHTDMRQPAAKQLGLEPIQVLCWPGEDHDNDLSRFTRSKDRDAFLRDYEFDVTPTTDDRPFFFHTKRLGDDIADREAGQENEQAVAVLRSVLWTVLWITLLAFFVPLLWTLRSQRLGRVVPATLRLTYFAALGIGFMLVEIPLLQRFGLYMGHPTWSLSVVLGSLLLGAGGGGMATSRVRDAQTGRALGVALTTIVLLLLLLAWLLPPMLQATLKWSFGARALVTAATLLPVGAALGMALPLGVRAIDRSASALVPWAWGINGVTSVLASVLAIAIGMEAGFTAALLTGIGCYALAFALSRRLH